MKTRTKILISIGVLYIFGCVAWVVYDFHEVGIISVYGAISLYMLVVFYITILSIQIWKK